MIVDEASTDDSAAVVPGVIAAGSAITSIRLDEKVGALARRGKALNRLLSTHGGSDR